MSSPAGLIMRCLFEIEEAGTPKKPPRNVRIRTYLRKRYDENQHPDDCRTCARSCRQLRLRRREWCRGGAPSGCGLGLNDRDQLSWMLAQLRVFETGLGGLPIGLPFMSLCTILRSGWREEEWSFASWDGSASLIAILGSAFVLNLLALFSAGLSCKSNFGVPSEF